MHISQISYRRVANLGNYETATLEVTLALNEGESPDDAFLRAKEWVEDKLGKRRAREG